MHLLTMALLGFLSTFFLAPYTTATIQLGIELTTAESHPLAGSLKVTQPSELRSQSKIIEHRSE